MTKTIFNTAARDEALTALRVAKNLGKRDRRNTSRDVMKGKTLHAVFIPGGRYEIHAGEEFGDIFVYVGGVLKHEENNRELADEIIRMAQAIA